MLILCMVCCLVLTGCDGEVAEVTSSQAASGDAASGDAASGDATSEPATSEPEVKDTLIGKWQGVVLSGETLKKETIASADQVSEEEQEMMNYMDFSGLSVNWIWEFKEDGTGSVSIDMASIKNDLVNAFVDGYWSYMEKVLAETGQEGTVEEAMGMTKDEMKQEVLKSEDFAADISMSTEFQYKDENGTVYVSEDVATAPATDKYFKYVFENGQLKMTEFSQENVLDGEDVAVDVNSYVPFLLTKVN